MKGHNGWVESLVSLNNEYLASGDSYETIKIWDTNTGNEIKTLKGDSGRVYSLAVLNNGYLASVPWGGPIKIWDTNTGN